MPWTSAHPPPAPPRRGARILWAAALAGLALGLPGGFGLAGAAPTLPTALALPLLGLAALLALPLLHRRPAAALSDPLTGLADVPALRAALTAILAGARPDRPPAVIALELDGFAAIRDTLGPEGGDSLLRQAAARLVATADTLTGDLRLALASVERARRNARAQVADHRRLLTLMRSGDLAAAQAELERHLRAAAVSVVARVTRG